MNRISSRLGFSALALVAGPVAMAQGTQTASATIDVIDASGLPLAGVSIRLTSSSLQLPRVGVSDAKGRFVARLLPTGSYRIELVKEGYLTSKATTPIGVDQNWQPRFTMQKTGGATVEVIAAAPTVDKSDVKTSTNFRMDTVDRLPNGRTMEAVADLTPGVVDMANGNGPQIRGAQASGNMFLIDGQNMSDNVYADRGIQVIDDSIEETEVLTGAISAEYGEVEGGVVNSVTRSGSNEFSGMLRWELRNPQWNARVNPGTAGFEQTLDNILSEEKTVSLGGYLVKDRLWFFSSYYSTDMNTAGSISSGAQGGYLFGESFTLGNKEIRRQAKLTWAINDSNTLVAAFTNSKNSQKNRDYSAGELLALIQQKNESSFYNLSFRSILSSNLTMEAKMGRKHQNLTAGNADNGQSPIYNYNDGYFYNQGIFNAGDGGDTRDNDTRNLKFSLFWDAAGSHQSDAGFDYYKGTIQSRHEYSPTNVLFGVSDIDLTNRTGVGSDMWTFVNSDGKATKTNIGFYFNDKWTLNKNFAFQMGVRWDKYTAKTDGGSTSASSSGLSPRLGMKYDIYGDSSWVLGISAARYNGKVLETILSRVTRVGNPAEIDYAYAGPAGFQPFAVLQDKANYDLTTVTYYNDPAVNLRINPSTKAPTVDEYQISAAHSFNWGAQGDGFVRLTAVSKKWNNMLDSKVGDQGTVPNPDPNASVPYLYIINWDNSKLARREYKDLEFDFQYNRNEWTIGGNVTWASLKGNAEGESTNSPGHGAGLENWTNVTDPATGVTTHAYDPNIVSPFGPLNAHTPLRMRLNASKVFNNSLGKTTVGWVYRFDSGQHFSNTRLLTRRQLAGPAGTAPRIIPAQAGTYFTQYEDNARGAGIYNATAYLDLAITHDFELFKVGSRGVNAFIKVRITNVFNHQQQITWNTQFDPSAAAYPNAIAAAWVPAASYGQTSSSDYGLAREYRISTGFRF